MTSTLSKKYIFSRVFDSQKVFRLLLEAMSNPARTVNIHKFANKLFGGHSTFLAVAMTLLDNDIGFHTCGNQSLSDEIVSLTFAKNEPIESADYIFVSNPKDMEFVIENAKRGTLADPHKSATIIIRNDDPPVCRLTLSGPGIECSITVQMTQTVKDAIAIRDGQNHEYPEGLDLLFISSMGELCAIPRLARMEAE